MNSGILKTAFQEMMKGVCTSVPCHILAFDPVLQRAQVQVGVEVVAVAGYTDSHAPLDDVPVLFLGGTQYSIIHQINPGDEGMLIFSQRCVDGWKQTGGVASNPLARFHDMHDAFFIPGFRPLPTCISDFPNDGIRMQSRDGKQHVWIKSSGEIIADNGVGSVSIAPDGAIALSNASGYIKLLDDGSVNINGAVIKTDGTIVADNVTYGGISGKDHKHTNVQNGPHTSGGPVN